MPMKGREHSQEYHLGLLWETLAHLEAEAYQLSMVMKHKMHT